MSKGALTSIIIIGALLLVGAGLGTYFLFFNSNSATSVGTLEVGDTAGVPLTPDGAFDLDQIDHDQPPSTPHGSFIVDGVDEALLGTWRLQQQTVVGQPNPFAGHMLTFNADGTLLHDYSTERADRSPECTVTGSVPARFATELVVDLDLVDDQSDPAQVAAATYPELQVTRKSSANPTVNCPGAQVDVESNSPVQPLGTGPSVSGVAGPHVPYTYFLDGGWNTLIIELASPSSTYTYVR